MPPQRKDIPHIHSGEFVPGWPMEVGIQITVTLTYEGYHLLVDYPSLRVVDEHLPDLDEIIKITDDAIRATMSHSGAVMLAGKEAD